MVIHSRFKRIIRGVYKLMGQQLLTTNLSKRSEVLSERLVNPAPIEDDRYDRYGPFRLAPTANLSPDTEPRARRACRHWPR